MKNLHWLASSYSRLRSSLYLQKFLCSALWAQGTVSVGKNIKVNHETIFQGKGQLILADQVALGYRLAGSSGQPILLQPRDRNAVIQIGCRSVITNGCELIACREIRIGENCLIGVGTLIMDSDFHDVHPDLRHTSGPSFPIIIGDNVWVGARCIILKGVIIERDAVIASGSVVYKNVGPGEIISSNAMRTIGSAYKFNSSRGMVDE